MASRTRDLELANAALEESSMVAPLTGLKNRRYLKAFMPEELAQTLRLQSARPRAPGVLGANIDLCVLTVELADQCLYAAKHSGRDGWVGCLLLAPDEAHRQGPAAGLREMPGFGRAEVLTSLGDAVDLRWDA